MKRWLSYCERNLLGRSHTLDELTEVMHMARRIAALLLLQPALDANYRAVKAASYVWPREHASTPQVGTTGESSIVSEGK